MLRKRRVTLQPGVPLHFQPLTDAYQPGWIKLEEFSVDQHRASWVVVTSKGQIIEGRAKGEQPLGLYPSSWISLAIPLKIHVRDRANAPEFILNIPGSITEKQ